MQIEATEATPKAKGHVRQKGDSISYATPKVDGKRYLRAFEVYTGHCPASTFYLMVSRGDITLIKVGRRSYCSETWPEIIERLGKPKTRA